MTPWRASCVYNMSNVLLYGHNHYTNIIHRLSRSFNAMQRTHLRHSSAKVIAVSCLMLTHFRDHGNSFLSPRSERATTVRLSMLQLTEQRRVIVDHWYCLLSSLQRDDTSGWSVLHDDDSSWIEADDVTVDSGNRVCMSDVRQDLAAWSR